MACVWSLHRHWRKAWDCNFAHPYLVCLHFVPYARLSADRLFCAGILDEYQKIYFICEAESCEIFINGLM